MESKDLRKIRKGLDLTQKQLAEMLGVAENTVARWERGELKIPPYLHLAMKQIRNELEGK